MYSQRGRHVTMILSLSICVLLRLPTYFAVEVYEYPKCDDFFRTKTASASPWVPESLVYHIYDFHLLSIAQTVLPFIILISFNFVSFPFATHSFRMINLRIRSIGFEGSHWINLKNYNDFCRLLFDDFTS